MLFHGNFTDKNVLEKLEILYNNKVMYEAKLTQKSLSNKTASCWSMWQMHAIWTYGKILLEIFHSKFPNVWIPIEMTVFLSAKTHQTTWKVAKTGDKSRNLNTTTCKNVFLKSYEVDLPFFPVKISANHYATLHNMFIIATGFKIISSNPIWYNILTGKSDGAL